MKKKCKIVMLTTEKESNSVMGLNPSDILQKPRLYYCKYPVASEKQHLYILSDEEIKEGDWCIYINRFGAVILCEAKHTKSGWVFQEPNENYGHPDGGITPLKDEVFKIIATTDPELKITILTPNNGTNEAVSNLPQISKDFIEAFIKAYNTGNPITEIMVEYEEKNPTIIGLDQAPTLKLRPDNTIIISKINERAYSKNDLWTAYRDSNTEWRPGDWELKKEFEEWFNENYPE